MWDDLLTLGILVGLTLTVSYIIYRLRKRVPHNLDMDEKNLLSTNFGFFTTLYCFFLGFAVVTLWSNYNDTDATSTNEAMGALTMYRLADNLPHSGKFRKDLLDYTLSVIDDEWPSMAQGRECDKTRDILSRTWLDLLRIKPAEPENQAYYVNMVQLLSDLDKFRHKRVLQINGNLYTPIWVLIYMGLAFSIMGFYFIDMNTNMAQVFYMGIMVCMLLTNILLIVELDKPFSGVLNLDPDAFKYSLKAMKAWP